MGPHYIFFSGGIGVGKTTIMNGFKIMLNKSSYFIVREYIDYHPIIGDLLLSALKRKEISDFAFQNYILDCYESQLIKIKNEQIILVERHPIEALEIFVARCNAKMTDNEKTQLKDRIDFICEKFNLPYLSDCNFNEYDTSLFSAKSIIDSLNVKINEAVSRNINTKIYGDICYLTSTYEDVEKRIRERGRPSEKNISVDYVRMILKYYDDYFAKLNFIDSDD